MGKNTDMVCKTGLTTQPIRAIGNQIVFTEKVNTYGIMVEIILETGRIILCTARVSYIIKIAVFIVDNFSLI